MRLRPPFAIGALVIIAFGGLIGFAAFSTDAPPVSTTMISAELPTEANGRIAAAAFAATLRGSVNDARDAVATPAPAPEPPRSDTATERSQSATTTSTTTTTAPPRPEAVAPAQAPTTTAAPPTTTTTTPPATTTTTTPPSTTTTTAPPAGGTRDVEEWRDLVAQYFDPERVDEALAVIHCESRGDPTAVNPISNASGLFQFVPNTWGWASAEAGWAQASVFDPEANVATAAWLVQVSIETNHPGGAWGHWSCQP